MDALDPVDGAQDRRVSSSHTGRNHRTLFRELFADEPVRRALATLGVRPRTGE